MINLTINGKKCKLGIDAFTVNYIRNCLNNKEQIEAIMSGDDKKVDISYIAELLGTFIRDRKTNQPVGAEFFADVSLYEVINKLVPIFSEYINGNKNMTIIQDIKLLRIGER